MAVYNGAQHLKESIDSILQQSFSNFEFIIVNDGSTDESEKIILSYKDRRIKMINKEHSGLADSLNKGAEAASSPWLARQDADDISDSNRLETQIAIVRKNPDLVLVGTKHNIIIDNETKDLPYAVFTDDYTLRLTLPIECQFCHGSVIMQSNAFKKAGKYNTSYSCAQDYDLWCRLAHLGKIANVPSVMYSLRHHNKRITVMHNKKQNQLKHSISRKAIQHWLKLPKGFNLLLQEQKENVLLTEQQKERFISLLTRLAAILIIHDHHQLAELALIKANSYEKASLKRALILKLNKLSPSICKKLVLVYAKYRPHLSVYLQKPT